MRGHPGYDSHATARWVAEPPKRAQAYQRGPFVRDRARVLHSSALRRLAAKTQVVEVGAGDFPRTRLTHSLECAQIGRELGEALGCDPDLVDAACLAHDLGHPPFGHNGEIVLADLAAGCGGFEGNAQSLRLLTRLEAKVPGAGLNLARATLDATIKYPWPAGPGAVPRPAGAAATQFPPPGLPGEEARAAPQKFGYYADDGEVFAWIRDGAPQRRTCLEAQVMDWADDVAYSVHDLEDGLHAGHITLAGLHDRTHQKAVADMTATYYCPPGSAGVAELSEVFGDLLALPCWPGRFDGGPAGLAALKRLTSELIGRFCRAAQEATLAASAGTGRAGLTRYDAGLEVPRRQRLECALLKGVAAHYVMSREGAAQVQARERELIAELAEAIRAGAPETLDPALRPAYEAAGSGPQRLRVVVDQVASLTDTSAIAWHRRLRREPAAAIKGGPTDAH
ncbi:MAG TPA: deoxyguanosinetriphosphate triphosphohydrolase [Streptosporangiaceae bacterium]